MTALVRKSIEKVTENAEAAAKREKNAVAALMEGLVLSGIAMSYIGNSRPASGSEHHMSHYWEMMFLLRHQSDPLHGTKVGVATVAALRLYEILKEKKNMGLSQQVSAFSYKKWAEEIEEAYGPAAPEVLKLEQEVGKNADNEVLRRRSVCSGKSSFCKDGCTDFKIDGSTQFSGRNPSVFGNF